MPSKAKISSHVSMEKNSKIGTQITDQRRNELDWLFSHVGKIRQKAIRTIMKKRGVSYEKARQIQSLAIARK